MQIWLYDHYDQVLGKNVVVAWYLYVEEARAEGYTRLPGAYCSIFAVEFWLLRYSFCLGQVFCITVDFVWLWHSSKFVFFFLYSGIETELYPLCNLWSLNPYKDIKLSGATTFLWFVYRFLSRYVCHIKKKFQQLPNVMRTHSWLTSQYIQRTKSGNVA